MNEKHLGTDESDADAVPDFSASLFIGAGANGTGNCLNGQIDESASLKASPAGLLISHFFPWSIKIENEKSFISIRNSRTKSKFNRASLNNAKSGQILMLVLFFFVVAVVITAVLASLWHVEIQVRSLEKNSQSAFYLAQAGIEEAKAWARTNSGTTSSTNVSMGSGRYRYIVSLGTGERIIDATGEVLMPQTL